MSGSNFEERYILEVLLKKDPYWKKNNIDFKQEYTAFKRRIYAYGLFNKQYTDARIALKVYFH